MQISQPASDRHSALPIIGLCLLVICFGLGSTLTVLHYQRQAQREVDIMLTLQSLIQQTERFGRLEARMVSSGALPIVPLETLLTDTEQTIATLATQRPGDGARVAATFAEYSADLRAELALVANGQADDASAVRESTTLVSGASVLAELSAQYSDSRTRESASMRNARLGMLAATAIGSIFICAVLVAYDHRHKRAYLHLATQETRFRSLIQQSTDIVMVVDIHGAMAYVTPAAEHAFGQAAERLQGVDLATFIVPEDRAILADLILATIASDTEPARGEARFLLRNRVPRTMDVVVTNMIENDAVRGIVITAHDITERKMLLESLRYQAHHDGLTGLPNRLVMEDRLQSAANHLRRTGSPVTVLFIDLDDFKRVNDRDGHAAGDELLIAAAATLRGTLRIDDTIARIGGDEFVVILENTDRDYAERVAERLSDALATLEVRGKTYTQRASIGICVAWDKAMPADRILKHADSAMYVVKATGKTGWHVYGDPEPEIASVA